MFRFLPFLFVLTACTNPYDRIAQLEKQTKELQAQVDKQREVVSLDLQSKCAAGAKTYFKENWGSGDRDTILLNYTNHYNKSSGKCFILIEYHFNLSRGGPSWANLITLSDAFEGTDYGKFSEHHEISYSPEFKATEIINECIVTGTKCKSLEEFQNLSGPYMQN